MTTIFLDKPPAWNWGVPRVDVGGGYIAHIHCVGARFHVISYHGRHDETSYIRCSEPNCIKNKPWDESQSSVASRDESNGTVDAEKK